jgi:Fe-S oxidoreductase
MLTPWEKIVFAVLILATVAALLLPIRRRFRIILAGRPSARTDEAGKRVGRAMGKVLLQRCTLRNERRFTGLMHVFIFYGALTFDTMTVNHTLEGFVPGFYLFGKTPLALGFSFLVDVFAVLVLAGVLFFTVRRFLARPKAYATSPLDSAAIYSFIILVTLSYLYFEMSAVSLHPEEARLSFLGQALAGNFLGGLNAATLQSHFRLSWWLHILLVFGFISYVPHSKYLHMFAAPFNVLFRRREPSGTIEPLDIENSESFGLSKAVDFAWKDSLDAFACMECGRCQDACPAFASGKPLSPKMILYNLERHLLANDSKIISRKPDELDPLVPGTFTEGEIWTCTTCGACMHVCPVEIEHIPKIVGLRQSQVLMESRFPQELNSFFRNVETNSNPWGIGFAKRGDWMEGLEIPLLRDKPGAEYLFWVGCMGSFDPEGQKTAKAMATIMIRAGLDFAVLGTEEKCCGDSARRLGNEYLFQTLARENLEVFKSRGVRTIVTICPHGYNTFKNEYPRIVDSWTGPTDEEKARLKAIRVLSHAELIRDLIERGAVPLHSGKAAKFTFHDPCYLGRHNGILEAPREVLWRAMGGRPVELANNREHSFCCGAGGGLMWTEETLGRRVNSVRTDEIIRSGAELAAVACPFCLSMLKDGLKDQNRPDIEVKDIAQIVGEGMERRS